MRPLSTNPPPGADMPAAVTNDELFAFLDGELPRDREEAIEAAAATDPELAARIAVVGHLTGATRGRLKPLVE